MPKWYAKSWVHLSDLNWLWKLGPKSSKALKHLRNFRHTDISGLNLNACQSPSLNRSQRTQHLPEGILEVQILTEPISMKYFPFWTMYFKCVLNCCRKHFQLHYTFTVQLMSSSPFWWTLSHRKARSVVLMIHLHILDSMPRRLPLLWKGAEHHTQQLRS